MNVPEYEFEQPPLVPDAFIQIKSDAKETLYEKIKSIVYHITLPVYLWSIGMKSLDEYIDALQEN
jgi:hypothetical protein